MATIELDLTVIQARALRRLLEATPIPALADPADQLAHQLDSHDAAVAARAPWRKVIRVENRRGREFEILECGHERMLNYTRNWSEEPAAKRRCDRCQRDQSKPKEKLT